MDEKYTRVFKVSIFAYIITNFIPLVIAVIAALFGGIGWIFAVIFLAIIVLNCLRLNAIKVWMDEVGINVYSGLLPWTRGINSIAWQDCGGAAYFRGFVSYMLKSYKISINHRFTNESNIVLYGIHEGDKLVTLINQYLAEYHKK